MEKELKEQIFKELAGMTILNGGMVIREGEAPKVYDPQQLSICGVIDTPLRWLEKRKDYIDHKQCCVYFNRDDMKILLNVNEHDHFCDDICGKLIISQEFKKFGINEGKYVTGLELSDLIRMNRTYFEDKGKAMELVTIMRNFKATVTKEIETNDDEKGNRMAYVRQVVEGNQPPSFELCIPIFKGQPKKTFTVEIDIDPETLMGTLVSPDAQDMMVEARDELMDYVIYDIAMLCPDIPIIEF